MQEESLKERNYLSQMECLYETYYVRLHRYAQTFLGDEDEATDVVGKSSCICGRNGRLVIIPAAVTIYPLTFIPE